MRRNLLVLLLLAATSASAQESKLGADFRQERTSFAGSCSSFNFKITRFTALFVSSRELRRERSQTGRRSRLCQAPRLRNTSLPAYPQDNARQFFIPAGRPATSPAGIFTMQSLSPFMRLPCCPGSGITCCPISTRRCKTANSWR